MKKVLIVDDEEMIRNLLTKMLSREGISTRCAEDGSKAIELLEENEFDLIISDLIMPKKEGLEVIMYLKKHNISTPLIVMSGGAKLGTEDVYLTMAKRHGSKYTFQKPFDYESFLSAVKDCLEID
jgi:DNA-binding NtrC family response regulator